jgi:hypothetical protein
MAKSILEEALLQVSQLEEAVKNNAKEILASTMKQEIDELVRESMEEPQIEEADDNEEVMETAEEVSEETTEVEESELEEQFEEEDEDDDEDDSEESEDEMDGDMEMGPEMDSEEGGMEDIDMPMLDLPSLDDEGDEDEVIDMTGASDEEILKVFKAMGDEDGIIVSQDEDGTVHLEDGDDEYRIEVNESEESEEVAEEEVEESMEDELSEESDEEVVYEIEIDETEEAEEEVAEEVTETEEEEVSEEEIEDEEEAPEADMEEASRTHAADARVPSNQGKKYKAGRADLSEEKFAALEAKNTELTEALKVFRDKLNEVGVFNANLAYATRLFTEHTTTKQEKLNILKRFDGIESLKESKALYNSIKNELTASDNKLTETVVNKISSSPQSGSSEKLVESKTYENPQIRRIKEMMGIVK